MGGRVTDKLTPQGKKFFEELQKLGKLQAQVGFTAEKSGHGKNNESVSANDYDDGPTIAEVAAWNEFGTKHIPERPFLRQSVDKNISTIKAMCAAQLKEMADGKADADKAIRAIGALQVGLIQYEIIEGDFVDNSLSTKKIKGGSVTAQTTPLIDTGRMRQSVHYVIKPREG